MRYKIIFSYYGRGYEGFQVQKEKPTIALYINKALSQVLKCDTQVTASGRTDSDVSAIAQVGHFDYDCELPRNFVGYINSLLPSTIRVASVEQAPNFHARYDAKLKTYEYKFYVSELVNAYYDTFALHVKNCDIDKVKKCAKMLQGTHDFGAFQATGSSVKDRVRTVTNASIDVDGDLCTFSITANGFLYNMVRIIMGTLIMMGSSDKPAQHMQHIIDAKDRKLAGKTVPAYPLVLKSVEY